jgi:thiosulfate reductase cytochrome b subunit
MNKTLCGRLRKRLKDFSSAIFRGCRYYGHALWVRMRHWGNAVFLAALRMSRIIKAMCGRLARVLKNLSRAGSRGYPYYRHPLPLRIMHWSNVVFLAVLLMSGLNIFNAHPALYWGKSSYRGVPPVVEMRGRENDKGEISGVTRVFGHDFDTTGFLGASREPGGELTERGFPSWLTIPDLQWLTMARRWHFFFAWLLLINGVTFVTYCIASKHLRHDLLPTRQDWRSIGRSIIEHLRFRFPAGEAAKHYNVLQKFAYLGVIFFLLPLMILMGLGMSPALDALHPGWVDTFFGRQSVRTIHFVVAWAIVLFVAVHVFEVIVSGFRNNLRSMITGYYRVESEEDHG